MEKNILVVEDNDVNLELLTLLIEQYSEEKELPIKIHTAINGQQAVDLCMEHSMDLVFMDIMMPTMNGSEATRIIKSNHPKTMVIVISTFGDEAKQKELLCNGAEDYMIKPINAPLFKSRLQNYLQIIEHRNHISNRPKAKNLFTSKIYNFHMNFTVTCEAELSEFWEAMLIRLDFQRHIDKLSDLVRFIFRLGTLQLHNRFQFHIYIEEDEQNFFFTLDNIQLIGCEQVHSMIERYYKETLYLCRDNLLTFVMQKNPLDALLPEVAKTEAQEEVVDLSLPSTPSTPAPEPSPQTAVVFDAKEPEELSTFDILEAEDLEDFETYLMKLRSLILLMENSTIESSDIEELCHCFDEMASIISISNDTYVLSNALHELSATITENQVHFEESSAQLFDFVNAFVNDLIFWKTKIFYEGAPSVDFLNDSITTNANMLTALLQPESETEADLDDIFDF